MGKLAMVRVGKEVCLWSPEAGGKKIFLSASGHASVGCRWHAVSILRFSRLERVHMMHVPCMMHDVMVLSSSYVPSPVRRPPDLRARLQPISSWPITSHWLFQCLIPNGQ